MSDPAAKLEAARAAHARRPGHEEVMMNDVAPEIVPAEALRVGAGRLRRFIGAEHGAGISYFFVDNDPGEGPGLHRHPYTETWVVIEGRARITIEGTVLDAVAGDTATVGVQQWHGFTNTGDGRLRVLCIHASDRIVQEWQDDPGVLDIPSSEPA